MDQTELERSVAAAGIDAPAYFREVTGSTNAWAAEWAEDGAVAWSVFCVDHQTAGRGRMGRRWVDRPGGALLFSFILRPDLPPNAAGLLSLLTGWAMAEAASELSGADVRCKWPNDLLMDERKVGGILAESKVVEDALDAVVIGVGVNLEAEELEGIDGAGDLGPVDRGALLTAFLRRFREAYRPEADGFVTDARERWRSRSSTLGRPVDVRLADGSRVRGEALDIDRGGALLVRTSDGHVWVTEGDVEHVRPE
jgi:BirA family biotin operon repressor/biotin-[acetyl-CoA-carboxylase] ligase